MTRAAAVVEVVVRALADNVEAVTVREIERGDGKTVEVMTGPGDLGRMIGRQGRMAAALRTLAAGCWVTPPRARRRCGGF